MQPRGGGGMNNDHLGGGEYFIRACANENIHMSLKGCGSMCVHLAARLCGISVFSDQQPVAAAGSRASEAPLEAALLCGLMFP